MPTLVDLNKERVGRSNDSRDWTPRDALVAAIKAIDDGSIKPEMVYIAFQSEPFTKPDGQKTAFLDHYAAGMTNLETAGLLALHLARCSMEPT